MQSHFDNNLLNYFTDVENLRGAFKEYAAALLLPKRLIVIHGVGGVGKSSLLRMFRIHCKSEKIPVALASGDDAKSVLDVTTHWVEDLQIDGVKFSSLSKTMETYRSIQAKVGDQAKKTQSAGSRMADIASKAASKTAETAGGALLGAAIGSVIPGVGTAIGGTLGGVVSGMGAEALADWLRGFLPKTDIDLILDPEKRLTTDFLADIAKAAEKKRIVLLLDTYEQMTALEDWVGEVAQKIHPNILMVVAGRKLPDWNRTWPEGMASAQVEELKTMTEDIMRQLIRRYYATMRGGEPDPSQVDAIVRFAGGLPMAVTSAVQLWVKYGVEDFQSVENEVVANLVDRLMEGVPSPLIPVLEAAAVVRWFDQPILRAVTGLEDVRDVYNELRRFPFVRTRVEGLALHDSVRRMMNKNLLKQDCERHAELHERATLYFEKRLEKTTGEEAERMGLERLYHRICTNEEAGIKLFREMAEELTRYRLVNRLRALLNDVTTYLLNDENTYLGAQENTKLWLEYYTARLAQLEEHFSDAERIYQMISENEHAESKLQAYALCDWGQFLSRYQRLGQAGGVEKATSILEKSLNPDLAELDSHLVRSLYHLARVQGYQRRRKEIAPLLEKARDFCEQAKDAYGLSEAYVHMKRRFASMGFWKDLFNTQVRMEVLLKDLSHTLPEPAALKNGTFGDSNWGWALAGQLSKGEHNAREGEKAIRLLGDLISLDNVLRDLGLILGYQDRYTEANEFFSESQGLAEKNAPFMMGSIFGFWGAILTRQGKVSEAKERLTQSIRLKEKDNDPGIVDAWVWLGKLHEIQKELGEAERYYNLGKEYDQYGIYFFSSESLTGLVRVKHAQRDYAAIPPLLAGAKKYAQQYEYNDHLASLQLTQGHLAWEIGKKDEAIFLYQHAMIYALRHNRFLLDELLSGRLQGTPLHSIIPYCLERGEERKEILIALRDWWNTGVNDIGTPRPDTISPIPEGISLLEAEKIAREREPGDGSPQESVIEQIEVAL